MWDDIGVFNCGYEWKDAGMQMVATFKTIMFPAIVWATLLQTVFGISMGVTGQATAFALLAAGYVPISTSAENSAMLTSSCA